MARRNDNSYEDTVAEGALLDDPEFLRGIVERAVQEVLEAEMTAHVGAGRYERGEGRTGHRNGYKPRELRTRVGTLSLLVPQDREGTFSTQLFARYQRNEKALVLALMEMYVEGVSTRKVTEITEELCGTSFSKSLVSMLCGKLDAELTAWRSRHLTARYPYLYVDARYEKVRVDGRIVSQGVLIVKGVREDGHREILSLDVADTESESTYQDLFRSLKSRGLSGVELVTSDDHKGLRAATGRHFQGASWQRCQGIDNLRAGVRNPRGLMRYSSYEHSHCFLVQGFPLPARNYQPRRLALPSLLFELPRCRRAPVRARHHGDL